MTSRVSFLRKQEPIATDVRGCERYLPFFSNEEPRSMGPGSALAFARLSGTTAAYNAGDDEHVVRSEAEPVSTLSLALRVARALSKRKRRRKSSGAEHGSFAHA
jgi:hypothetical protein